MYNAADRTARLGGGRHDAEANIALEQSPDHDRVRWAAEAAALDLRVEVGRPLSDALRDAAVNSPDGEPYLLMAQLYLQREQYGESRVALRDALAAYGEQAPSKVYYLLAIAELNLDALDAAEVAINALESDPEFAQRAVNLRRSLAARQAF